MELKNKRIVVWSLALSALVAVACGLLPGGEKAEAADAAKKAEPAASAKVLAKVNGQPITQADVETTAADQLKQLEERRQQLIAQSLDATIANKMLDLEAATQGVTREQLLDREVKAKSTEATDAEVDAFYEQRKGQINQPKEQVAPRIKQYLAQQKQAELYETYMTGLKAKYKVENLLEAEQTQAARAKAKDVRATVETGNAPAKGPTAAPVQIVEFSDFQCPFCSRVVPTLDQVAKNYGEKVRIQFRQFPLHSIHPLAQKAAEAALCAHEQGKFWEMHDAMFLDQKSLAVEQLKEKAGKLGLDAAQFASCLDSGKTAPQVQADLDLGMKVGVNSTPALFINGRLISGAQPYDEMAKVIDQELASAGKSST
jgi:protein-disulfide isomerase